MPRNKVVKVKLSYFRASYNGANRYFLLDAARKSSRLVIRKPEEATECQESEARYEEESEQFQKFIENHQLRIEYFPGYGNNLNQIKIS